MADRGMYKTTELIPLLREFGVHLSREQTFRLVTQTPERANLTVVAAICAALNCSIGDLIETEVVEDSASMPEPTRGSIGDLRPKRATITRPATGTTN